MTLIEQCRQEPIAEDTAEGVDDSRQKDIYWICAKDIVTGGYGRRRYCLIKLQCLELSVAVGVRYAIHTPISQI